MSTEPEHYLVSTAGNPNFGDEFITAAWLRFLAVNAPNAVVWLDCPNPGAASLLFEGLHPGLRITDTLWRAVRDSGGLPPGEAGPRVSHLVRHLGSPRYDMGLVRLRRASSLHLLGGGYVNGMWPHHTALVSGMKAVKELTGARLYATGQGLMPLIGTPREAADLFLGFDHVTVRDAESARAYSLNAGLDDAFLGLRPAARLAVRRPAATNVCIQADMMDANRFDEIVAAVRLQIKAALSEGRQVNYLEAIPGIDRRAYDQLSDLIAEENFFPFTRVWDEGIPAGPDQQWLTTRFHFHLLASAAGSPGIAYAAREGYYDVKHQSLIRLGTGWALDTRASPAEDFPSGKKTLRTKADTLTALKLAEARKIYPSRACGL
ncbi:polysaccharide pyruvyl transferase family protein [Arthrobacter sp. APC 3897]|uniref:polysaccharide pyruvyl transferase family protein n=1 Tax=Arthrobacter sp. APC 3897 TaxID=3035204 RepID=UPI0025B2D0EF|nr:polysaccharide pyruvyl transferase family protein [Arthrobacter sp. APC 3897]MDN3480408.1 polysaccharide pyruvyl transferase family protein [Arthrobacter sp. APC 3897]